jgi:hypothetical protein
MVFKKKSAASRLDVQYIESSAARYMRIFVVGLFLLLFGHLLIQAARGSFSWYAFLEFLILIGGVVVAYLLLSRKAPEAAPPSPPEGGEKAPPVPPPVAKQGEFLRVLWPILVVVVIVPLVGIALFKPDWMKAARAWIQAHPQESLTNLLILTIFAGVLFSLGRWLLAWWTKRRRMLTRLKRDHGEQFRRWQAAKWEVRRRFVMGLFTWAGIGLVIYYFAPASWVENVRGTARMNMLIPYGLGLVLAFFTLLLAPSAINTRSGLWILAAATLVFWYWWFPWQLRWMFTISDPQAAAFVKWVRLLAHQTFSLPWGILAGVPLLFFLSRMGAGETPRNVGILLIIGSMEIWMYLHPIVVHS